MIVIARFSLYPVGHDLDLISSRNVLLKQLCDAVRLFGDFQRGEVPPPLLHSVELVLPHHCWSLVGDVVYSNTTTTKHRTH